MYRRKEQNQIKRSIGFNWGPAAMATTVWTGVPLRHVLAAAGVTKPEQGRRFVCFAGPKVRPSAGRSRRPCWSGWTAVREVSSEGIVA